MPSDDAFSRFLALLMKHEAYIEKMFHALVERLRGQLPDLGKKQAADSKAISSYDNPVRDEGKQQEQDRLREDEVDDRSRCSSRLRGGGAEKGRRPREASRGVSKFSHLAGLGAVDGGWGEAKSVRATLRGGSAPAPGARRAAATASNHRQREWLNMSKAIDKVRATEAKELKKKGIEVLKHARWCVLKRPKNLTEKQETKLAELARWNLKTFRAYLLKEDFQGFWNYVYPAWAGKFLDRWCTPTMRSRIEPMKKIARSLRKHRPLILNWFKARGVISLGAVEGLNTRLKLTVRKLTDLLIS